MKRIQVASKGKRIVSSLIDLVIIGGLFALSYFFIFYKAVASINNFSYHNSLIVNTRKETYLYNSTGDKTKLEENPNMDYKSLDTCVNEYYTKYLFNRYKEIKKPEAKDKTYTPYWYGVVILHLEDTKGEIEGEKEYKEEERLYKWTDATCSDYEVKSGVDTKDLLEFQRGNFGTAVYNLSLSDLTPIKASARIIAFGNARAFLYSSMLSTFIPCFIVPICLKNGKTVGKLITGLIVLTDEGYEYKRYKHIFRYLSFYGVEVFGGVITIGITFILSTCLVLFSKKHKALHDYISFSCVADEKNTVFYKDINEENEYKNKDITELRLE